MRGELKRLVASIPFFSPFILALWARIRKIFDRGESEDLPRFDGDDVHNNDTEDISIDDDFIVEAAPYIDARSRGDQELCRHDVFYLEFANVFRGSRDFIKGIHAKYVEYVCKVYERVAHDKYFLDVGCGRGEFLELLSNAQIPAKGLEINEVEYENLIKKGFDVRREDCNTFLGKLEDNSLIGISALQVVEHFYPDYLQRFIRTCYEKVCSNGVLILETVNTKCYPALTNFFIDITHVRPYPSEALKFLLEWHGFTDVRTIYFSPCSEEFRQENLSEYNYMDYAIISYKK